MFLGDQGIKFCSKIQSVWNRFKLNESVGLIIVNPMQLVRVQTDVGSERYRVLFKFTNRQKKKVVDCTVYTYDDVAGRTTRGRMAFGQLAGDLACLAMNGATTRGPVNGRHVSSIIWLKLMSLPGVDPATSGQGKLLGKEPPTGTPPCVTYYIYGMNCIKI
jgi:hypothetical protein